MQLLLIDIETAPHKVYAWGLWGQDISIDKIVEPGYTMCWAAKWYKKKGVIFDSIHKSKPENMVKNAHDLIDQADAVIHYNGTRFDIPTLNQEFILHGLTPPSPVTQIDLLHTARKKFRLPSNKLDYVARHLGLEGKVKHVGMELWKGCMDGDDKCWRDMERYNKRDVTLLEEVYDRLLPWIDNHPNRGLWDGDSRLTCTNCGGKNLTKQGTRRSKTNTYQQYQCQDCGSWNRSRKNNTPKATNEGTLVRSV